MLREALDIRTKECFKTDGLDDIPVEATKRREGRSEREATRNACALGLRQERAQVCYIYAQSKRFTQKTLTSSSPWAFIHDLQVGHARCESREHGDQIRSKRQTARERGASRVETHRDLRGAHELDESPKVLIAPDLHCHYF